MSKLKKFLAGALVFATVFFGFIIVRIGVVQPSNTTKVVPIPESEALTMKAYANAYPLQYQSFMMTAKEEPSPTGYGGSHYHQRLDNEPEMRENFKGYRFAIDYADDRGHALTMEDLFETKRLPGQKGNCIICKSPYTGKFYAESGWAFAAKPFEEVAKDIPEEGWLSCATCHDPQTMNLRVFQPAFIQAMKQHKGIDVNTQATREEMRAYVCGQCHNEYHFDPTDSGTRHPLSAGAYTAEDMYDKYYATVPNGFKQDWIHTDSKTPVLKAQHPDFETWATSVHAEAGVTCIDCHMPYMRSNGQKYTSHYVTSPLKTVEESCLKCHTQDKETLIQRVKTIHDNTFKLQRIAGITVMEGHRTIKAAMDAGATDEALAVPREHLRRAQWYWDYVAAENGVGFHNPDQIMRTLGLAIDFANQAINSANAIVKGKL